MACNAQATANHGEIVIYQTPGGAATLDVRLRRDTVWLSQRQHEGELDEISTHKSRCQVPGQVVQDQQHPWLRCSISFSSAQKMK
jgi:SOS-response transcriptional repressor LexA